MPQHVDVMWVALECQQRQEKEDEVFGTVSAIPGVGKPTVHSFPGDRKYWTMGKSGERIVTVGVPLYSGPPTPLSLMASMIENDSDNVDEYKKLAAEAIAKGSGAVAAALTGGASAPAQPVIDALAKVIVELAGEVLGTADDPYNPGAVILDAATLADPNRPRLRLQRPDDPRTAEFTDKIILSAVDDGGDRGTYAFYFDVRVKGQPDPAQRDWRYCKKCHGMFFDGYPEKGKCSGGGGHAAAGYNFVLPHDVAGTVTQQRDWRYCKKCHGMFFDGYPEKGKCSGGGGHAAAGYNFALPHTG